MPQEIFRSHLFTLRLWLEVLDSEHTEIRGVAKHVLTGNLCNIRGWSALQAFLTEQLATADASNISSVSSDTSKSDDETE